MRELLDRGLIARQEFDHAEAAFRSGEGSVEATRQRVDVAHAEVAQAEAEVAAQEVALIQARRLLEGAEAALAEARSRRREVTIRGRRR